MLSDQWTVGPMGRPRQNILNALCSVLTVKNRWMGASRQQGSKGRSLKPGRLMRGNFLGEQLPLPQQMWPRERCKWFCSPQNASGDTQYGVGYFCLCILMVNHQILTQDVISKQVQLVSIYGGLTYVTPITQHNNQLGDYCC